MAINPSANINFAHLDPRSGTNVKVHGQSYRTIFVDSDGWTVQIIDQTKLPHDFQIVSLQTVETVASAIKNMMVRGAPLIGATAAYGVCLAMRQNSDDKNLEYAQKLLGQTRPTAVNLHWALNTMGRALSKTPNNKRVEKAYDIAASICSDDINTNRQIGKHGYNIIKELAESKPPGSAVNILTHCNAGWLATVDWGTATAPVYAAHDAGVAVHVWVDETRPRNQGAALTAFELGQHGVPHTVIADNTGGHLMQTGGVDVCIVGTDRTTATGLVINKIGTYLKALAAKDNAIPFYVALPSSTIDWSISDSDAEKVIEERSSSEVTHIQGRTEDGSIVSVQLTPDGSEAANYAFDLTPAHLITGLITERGITEPCAASLARMFPEHIR